MRTTHQMRMVRAEESGAEEWACPTCGRTMLLRWPPHHSKTIIEAGDERACHVGSSADLPTVAEPAPGAPDAATEPADPAATGAQPCSTPRRRLRETGVDPALGRSAPA